VIVDYANVVASLEKALAIYGAGRGGKNPVQDKQKLVEELRKAVDDAAAFCTQHQVVLADIEKLAAGSFERLQRIEDALNALISPDPVRRDFLGHDRLVATLYRAVKPDPAALAFAGRVACIGTIADAIRAKLKPNPADISEVIGDINTLLDESITGMTIRDQGPPALDLSKINFEALANRIDGGLFADAGQHILQGTTRGMMVEHVVGRKQWHTGGIGHAMKPRQPAPVVAAIQQACGEPHAIGRARTQSIQHVKGFSFLKTMRQGECEELSFSKFQKIVELQVTLAF